MHCRRAAPAFAMALLLAAGAASAEPAPVAPVAALPDPAAALRSPAAPARTAKNPPPPSKDVHLCVAPQEIDNADGDIARNMAALASPELCIKLDEFHEGGLDWTLMVIQHKREPNRLLWMVPHNNEHDAFDSALDAVAHHHGTVVAVKTGGNRTNGLQDPNRNFDIGSGGKCHRQVARSPIYTQRVMRWRAEGAPIIALHTNEKGYTGDGGEGTGLISMLHPMPRSKPLRAKTGALGELPDDTMVFVASPEKPDRDAKLMGFVNRLRSQGINVMYETVSRAGNDCSMSNYAALKHVRDYVNIEVVEADGDTQRAIIDVVMGELGRRGKDAVAHAKPKSAAASGAR